MSDNGEVEVENPSGYQVLPKEVTDEIGSIKLFNKWSYEDVEIRDISLTYVSKTSARIDTRRLDTNREMPMSLERLWRLLGVEGC